MNGEHPLPCESRLRDLDEIQRAHDQLVGVAFSEPPIKFVESTRKTLEICAGVLCWCLHHDHSEHFQILLDALEAKVAEASIVNASTHR
jgi:hypothetical protein